MIVADTGAVIALIDSSERNHKALRALYEKTADEWMLPWAILPEVDYLLGAHVSAKAQQAFLDDLAEGAFNVDWGNDGTMTGACRLAAHYQDLKLGLVDAVVVTMAIAVRARAIATLDLRHFGAITEAGMPKLFPRDLPAEAGSHRPGGRPARSALRR